MSSPSPAPQRRLALILAVAAAATVPVTGCTSFNESLRTSESLFGLVTPYRMEIVQGNVVTKEQVAQIKPGATRNQVRDVLGSPMLADIFHADRWDYVFTIKRQGTEPQRRAVVVLFDGDKLKSVDAPADLPDEREFVKSISRTSATGRKPVLELTEAERAALPRPAKAEPTVAAASAVPAGPLRSYPPLEAQ